MNHFHSHHIEKKKKGKRKKKKKERGPSLTTRTSIFMLGDRLPLLKSSLTKPTRQGSEFPRPLLMPLVRSSGRQDMPPHALRVAERLAAYFTKVKVLVGRF
jgi:hypothetical protein